VESVVEAHPGLEAMSFEHGLDARRTLVFPLKIL
jgi:hypothetical protein